MHHQALRSFLLPAALCAVLVNSNPIEHREPTVTTPPTLHDAALRRRDVKSDIESGFSDITGALASDVGSALSAIGSDVPSFVASGIPAWYTGIPDGPEAVQSSLGIDDDQVAALPTNALNMDPYAHYTDEGWQIRFRGFVYKQPNATEEKLNDLANIFFVGEKVEDLPQNEQENARNVTAEIFVLLQGDVNVSSIHIEPAESQGGDGEQGGGGAVTPNGGTQDVTLPDPTTAEGDFDVFVPINSNGLARGNETNQVQRLNTFISNTTLGNGTAYLVPNEGITVISDIDDILRVTRIWQPEDGLIRRTFAEPFEPWEEMPVVYRNWSQSIDGIHFHYLTTTPEQITRTYMQFIYTNYPGGSFDTRPLNFSNIDETLSVRKYLLDKVFQAFPQRKFVLMADTSNSDVMKDYPQLAHDYPDQVQCIFLRNTTATDDTDNFPYDTSGFEGLNQRSYMFFVNSEDLMNLDIANGQCYNTSVAQNLTFGYQGLPLGIGDKGPVNGSANNDTGAASGLVMEGGSRMMTAVTASVLGFLLLQLL
ncbi:hypothetical protein K431DRAFT_282164 [Polychaeton citri CBS 116435]|uniref:Phosphatidate phosphatase APP1 catalytic domain-containing protein n=1 Tax=Polychaeton citri CBS 116435 TaxID=1314669 RepID=A0A9P4QG77_9PEZI|nr:hypothetical protein K431DRAFT_282164 [Polychaeton citri CBS 116435]